MAIARTATPEILGIPDLMPISGNPDAPIVVICDSPTKEQWRKKVPLGGRSFEFWAEQAIAAGFTEHDFCYVMPCAPIPEQIEGSDRKTKDFVDQYRDSLRATLDERSNAKLYLYFGKTAGYALTGKPVRITKQRGVARRVDSCAAPVLPLFSPKHVLTRPEVKDLFVADMRMLEMLRDSGYRPSEVTDTIADVHYEWRSDISDLLENRPKSLAFDTETVGTKWYDPATRLLTVQVCCEEGKAIAVPWCNWPNNPFGHMSQRALARVRRQVKELLEDPTIRKSSHNGKFDTHILRREGIEVRGLAIDTQLLAFFIDENMFEKSQDECVRRWVSSLGGYADAFNRDPVHHGKTRMDLVPPDMLLQYAAGDADANFRLAKTCAPMLQADAQQWNCYRRVQWPALRAFMDVVEPAGILIDTDELAALQQAFSETAETEYRELIEMVPAAVKRKHLADMKKGQKPEDVLSFSRDSFTRDVLFTSDGFGLKPKVFTKTTAKLGPDEQVPSVSTKTHLPYFDHPFIPKLTNYQRVEKLRNTYVGLPAHDALNARGETIHVAATGFWRFIDSRGFIHPSFILHRTVTGRAASAQPNGQNLPKHGSLAKQYRKIFKARAGYTLIESDYAQAELRIAAWMADERAMLKIFNEGGDIHTETAIDVLGIPRAEFFALSKEARKEYRQKAKACIAEGSLVLTDRGLVPIESVLKSDLVWDGIEWVRHDGVIFKGYKDVITYDGVTATPDHKVFDETGRKVSIGELASEVCGPGIGVGEIDGAPVGYAYDNWSGSSGHASKDRGGVQRMPRDTVGFSGQSIGRQNDRLPMPAKRQIPNERPTSANPRRAVRRHLTALHKSAMCRLRGLRRAWDRVSLYARRVCSSRVDALSWAGVGGGAYRSPGQQWPLRAGKLAVSDIGREQPQSEKLTFCGVSGRTSDRKRSLAFVENRPSRLHAVSNANGEASGGRSVDCRHSVSETEAGLGRKARVYDIVNAGPRHRFTVSGRVVSNCAFGFLYGMGWLKFMSYAKTTYGVVFTEKEAQRARDRFFAKYPRLVTWHKRMRALVAKNGHIRALHGAKRNLPNIRSIEDYIKSECERQAINSGVQRFASDLGLMALGRLCRDCNPELIRPIAFIHDALVCEVRNDYVEEGARNLVFYMESNPLENWFSLKAPLPITADVSVGANLAEMEERPDLSALAPEWYDWRADGYDEYPNEYAIEVVED